MSSLNRRTSRIAALLAAVAAGLIGVAPPGFGLRAQDVDCTALRARIDAGRDPRGPQQSEAALQQQQFELERLRNYSDSIGCGSGFFFGAPPQCDGIERRIARLQDTVERLREQVQEGGENDGWTRRALIEQYNATCTAEPGGEASPGPGDPDAAGNPDDGSPSGPVHSKALCVRHCDGGFFPLTDQASAGNLDRLGQICKALCPNAEASLYTVAPEGGIETAVAPDGTAYTALPAAFRFQKTYDPACSCKAANQSWAEALADAERLLEKNKDDVVVTKRMSDAMARPVQPGPAEGAPAAKSPKAGKTQRNRKSTAARTPPNSAPTAPFQGEPGLSQPAPIDPDGESLSRQFRRSEPTL